MDKNFKVGDVVVWDFVFDMPQECGEIVEIKGDKVRVEYRGYRDNVYRDWMSCEEIDFEENYL